MKTLRGTVTGTKMIGTVTVTVHRSVLHKLYRKSFPVTKKYLVDPGTHAVHVGDVVEIAECRPLSKRKCFRIAKVIATAAQVSEIREEAAIEKAIHREKHAPEGSKHSSSPSA
jgi:small subunit ribosomal protein S17